MKNDCIQATLSEKIGNSRVIKKIEITELKTWFCLQVEGTHSYSLVVLRIFGYSDEVNRPSYKVSRTKLFAGEIRVDQLNWIIQYINCDNSK